MTRAHEERLLFRVLTTLRRLRTLIECRHIGQRFDEEASLALDLGLEAEDDLRELLAAKVRKRDA